MLVSMREALVPLLPGPTPMTPDNSSLPPGVLPTRTLYVSWLCGVCASDAAFHVSVMVESDGLPTAFTLGVVGVVLANAVLLV